MSEEPSSSSKKDDDYAAALAESARVDAEARRRRILEKSNQRLGIVSGEVVAPKATAAVVVAEENTTAAAPTEGGDDTTTGAAASGKSASSAARMQAMRKRRFKKSEAAAEDAAAATAAASTSETATATTTTTDDAPKEKEIPAAAPETTTVETEVPSTTTAESSAPTENDATDITASASDDADGSKKKYLGVAKMRRQMIKKKQEQEQQEAPSTSTISSSTTSKSTTSTTGTSSTKIRKLSTAAVLVPVLLHMLTILLLFGAGLQVGLQQGRHWQQEGVVEGDTTVLIQNEWGPRHRGLLSWLDSSSSNSNGNSNNPLAGIKTKTSIRRDIVVDDDEEDVVAKKQSHDKKKKAKQQDPDKNSKMSEFEETILSIPTEENIDPIFRIDLDKVTEGPGLLLQLARGAVAIHRLLVTIFLIWPRRFLVSLWRLPYNLWTTPPILCGLALFIRQVIAKLLLGDVKLPQQQQQAYEPKNLVTMVLQTGITFLSKTFPTLARMYEAWNHLRSDLYIVMCGLFVGMAWIYSFPTSDGTSRLVTRDDEL